jgi:hypothetical protein
MPRIIDNFDLTGAFSYLVEDVNEGGLGLTKIQAHDQIARRLGRETGFDVDAAQKAGFSNDEIISKLTSIPQRGALQSFGKGVVEQAPEAVAGAAGTTGAIKAADRYLKAIPNRRLRALGYLGTGLAGSVAGMAAEEAIPLEEATLGRLTPEDRVLPSDMPFYKAGAATGTFASYSYFLRDALKKIPQRELKDGKRKVDTGLNLGADDLLKNAEDLAKANGRIPLSYYRGKAAQILETGAEKLGARARGDLPGYGVGEAAFALGAGVGGGLAESLDPGDPKSQFIGHILGGAFAPVGWLIRGGAKVATGVGGAYGSLKELGPSGVVEAAAAKVGPKTQRAAKNELNRVIKLYDEGLEATAKESGLPYIPVNAKTIKQVYEAYPKALAELGYSPEQIEKMQELATWSTLGAPRETSPLSYISALLQRHNPELRGIVEAADKKRQMLYAERFMDQAGKSGEPKYMAAASALFRSEVDDLLLTALQSGFNKSAPIITNAVNTNRMSRDEGSIAVYNLLEDQRRMIGESTNPQSVVNVLYNGVDQASEIRMVNLAQASDSLKGGTDPDFQGGSAPIQKLYSRISDEGAGLLADAGIGLPVETKSLTELSRKYRSPVESLKKTLQKADERLDSTAAYRRVDELGKLTRVDLTSAAKEAALKSRGDFQRTEAGALVPRVQGGQPWEGSNNLFVAEIRDELKNYATNVLDPTKLGAFQKTLKGAIEGDFSRQQSSAAVNKALAGGTLGKREARAVEWLLTSNRIEDAALSKLELGRTALREIEEQILAQPVSKSLAGKLPWEEAVSSETGKTVTKVNWGRMSDATRPEYKIRYEIDALLKKIQKDLDRTGLDMTTRDALAIVDPDEVARRGLVRAGPPSVPTNLSFGEARALRTELSHIGKDTGLDTGTQAVAFRLRDAIDGDFEIAGENNVKLKIANDFNKAYRDFYYRLATGRRANQLERTDSRESLLKTAFSQGSDPIDKAASITGLSQTFNFVRSQRKEGALKEANLGLEYGAPSELRQALDAAIEAEGKNSSEYANIVRNVFNEAIANGGLILEGPTGMPFTIRETIPQTGVLESTLSNLTQGGRSLSPDLAAALETAVPKVNAVRLNQLEAVVAAARKSQDTNAPETNIILDEIFDDIRDVRTLPLTWKAITGRDNVFALNSAKAKSLSTFEGVENSQAKLQGLVKSATPVASIQELIDPIVRAKNSVQPTHSSVAGTEVEAKVVYPELTKAIKRDVLETAINLSEAKGKPGEGRVKAIYDLLFETSNAVKPNGEKILPKWPKIEDNNPTLMQLLSRNGLITKEEVDAIETLLTFGAGEQYKRAIVEKPLGWIAIDDAVGEQLKVIQGLDQPAPGKIARAVAQMSGALGAGVLGRLFTRFLLPPGFGGAAGIKLPQVGSQAADDLVMGQPRIVFLDSIVELTEPGNGGLLLDFIEEPTEESVRSASRFLSTITGGTVAPYTATMEYFTEEDPLGRPKYYPTRETLGLAERGSLAPEPPAQMEPPPPAQPQPIAAAQPPPQPSPASPAMRSQYAAAFPFDPASDIIRQQQARAPTQQGIGSLV